MVRRMKDDEVRMVEGKDKMLKVMTKPWESLAGNGKILK